MLVNKADEPAVDEIVDNSQPDDSVNPDDNVDIADDDQTVVDDPELKDHGDPPKLPHSWMSGLTAEQKADKELIANLSKFEKGLPDMAKAFDELSRKSGKPTVPGEDATEEEVAAYREAIGVPKTPKDYELSKIELPEDSLFKPDEAGEGQFLEWFHELGLTPEQVNGLREKYYPYMADSLAEAQKVCKLTEAEALAQFSEGLKPEEAKRGRAFMARAFEKFGSPEVAELLERTGLGNFPPLLKQYAAMGEAIGESLFVDTEADPGPGGNPIGKRTNAELAHSIYGEK